MSDSPTYTEETGPRPGPVPTVPRADSIHPKVAVPTFAGMAVGTFLIIAKQKWGWDLSGQEIILTQLLTGLIGWLVPGGTNG